jgi:hypothetical protein
LEMDRFDSWRSGPSYVGSYILDTLLEKEIDPCTSVKSVVKKSPPSSVVKSPFSYPWLTPAGFAGLPGLKREQGSIRLSPMSEAELQALVRSIEELRESQKETDRALRELSGLFSTQWGKLVEALVEPGCVDQFRKRGIAITRSMRRAEGIDSHGRQMEIDVLLINGEELVAVEVKTTCKTDDVKEHEDRLERFRDAYPEYRSMRVYGAVAALLFESESDKYAYRHGMFVLKPTEGVAQIVNDTDFKPRVF